MIQKTFRNTRNPVVASSVVEHIKKLLSKPVLWGHPGIVFTVYHGKLFSRSKVYDDRRSSREPGSGVIE
jgi:hypothetical protein